MSNNKVERKIFCGREASRVSALLNKFETYVKVLQMNGGIDRIWDKLNNNQQNAIKALVMDIRSKTI